MNQRARAGLSAVAAVALLAGTAGWAAADELNLYSARHYQTDDELYDRFTELTGIAINRIEDSAERLQARIASEGANSPADVLISVDAGRLWWGVEADMFQSTESEALTRAIPANLRHPDGLWFGFSTRARVIYYNRELIAEEDLPTSYEDLADPKYAGEICIRSGSNVYNLSLLASLIEHHGEAEAEEWARGVVANMARPPEGGDTDQILAAAAGVCSLAVANTYYFVRLLKSDEPEHQAAVQNIGVIFPNQDGRGTHVNVSGAGVLKHAPNPGAAVKFLEYLASPEAQEHYANGNNEYAVVDVTLDNPELESLGTFIADPVNLSVYGLHQPAAQMIFDRVGWR